MSESEAIKPFNVWEKIEGFIKNRESLILLLVVLLALIYIPFKILAYGWAPSDDALRHVAFATTEAKWNDIVVIDEKFASDHNPGWHAILRFLHKHCGFDKTDLLFFSVAGLFCLINICGALTSPSPICWCLALLIFSNVESGLDGRMLLGRPYIFSGSAVILLMHIWKTASDKENFAWFRKSWAKYLLTLTIFTLCVWIHGSWYLFLLIPASFFLSGKTKDALQQVGLLILSTILGAVISGDFYEFLYFHFAATFQIFSEPTYNWLLVSELASGKQSLYSAIFIALIIAFCYIKKKLTFKSLTEDPVFILVLLSWLCGVAVWRFWLDWGRIALLIWASCRLGDLINVSTFLKQPRIRYCLAMFVVVAMVMCITNDAGGRYTRTVRAQAIDFFNEELQKELKGWEPQPGGIVYSDNMVVFYKHFYEYPTAPWKYILGFESALMLPEDLQTLRNIGYNDGKLPDDFLPWINKMTSKDRLILTYVPGDFPQIEWKKGNRYFWIGRLKAASDTAEISKP